MKVEKRFIAFMSLTAAVSFLAYLNAAAYPFVFNTISLIQENEALKTLKNIPSFFTEPAPFFSPLAMAAFAVDYSMWGMNSIGFRITNIILHALTSVLVGLFLLYFLNRRGAVFSALIFALHPAHTEAVTGIAGRGEILAAIFTLVSFALFLKQESKWLYAASLFAFLLALLSSKTTLALPILLAVYSLYFIDKKSVIRTIPYFIFSALYLLLYISLNRGSYLEDISIYSHILSSLKVFGIYIRLILFPVGLNAWHDFPVPAKLLSFDIVFPLQMFLILTLCLIALYSYSKRISFALLFILLTLLPSLHIIPQMMLMKEAYLYLPLIGFSLLIGVLFEKGGEKSIKLAGSIFLLPIVIFSVIILQRNAVWKDNFTILRDAAAKSPDSAILHYNMGVVYDDNGLFNEAVKEYETAIKLNRRMVDAYYNIACVYSKQGNIEGGFKALKWATAYGFRDINKLLTDPDLERLRHETEFSDIIESIKKGDIHGHK
ncbi:MAG: hypothetical protein A3G39_11585 [Deltaproteobacteria bacterium RIFCSPLOWO2_12_FULL_43_16]|nr:MAG: hypothetical protein A3D30_05275 [Deltaproteobacteria bacterium RIFCSPHIGHO2_02_FULL_43_33]OGQ57696.1 MAG: hypothetical protein A3G39_11585 [Deltaproteobacteria bacterium RIFCSPLOWO2_12_FULL_43_16]HBR16274.1 hypothetical protein [Deltaproteobacteria bacterium]